MVMARRAKRPVVDPTPEAIAAELIGDEHPQQRAALAREIRKADEVIATLLDCVDGPSMARVLVDAIRLRAKLCGVIVPAAKRKEAAPIDDGKIDVPMWSPTTSARPVPMTADDAEIEHAALAEIEAVGDGDGG